MALKRNFALAIALIGAALAPALAQAAIGTGSIVTITRGFGSTYGGALDVAGDYGNKDDTFGGASGGGEFRVIEQSPPFGSGTEEVFKTFCLEYNEHITVPGTYNVTINDSAYFGGVGTSTVGSPRHDKLSEITVFLYSAYRNNALKTWDLNGNTVVDDFVYDSATWAEALQFAIWRAEEEFGTPATSNYGGLATLLGVKSQADLLYNYAAANLPLVSDTANVKVMNLWSGTPYEQGNARQSQLYYGLAEIEVEGVPEPASLVIWGAGLGIAGLVAARRRKLAKA